MVAAASPFHLCETKGIQFQRERRRKCSEFVKGKNCQRRQQTWAAKLSYSSSFLRKLETRCSMGHTASTIEINSCAQMAVRLGRSRKWHQHFSTSAVLKLMCASQPRGCVKLQAAGPHPWSFWLKGSGVESKNLFLTSSQGTLMVLVQAWQQSENHGYV